MEDLRKKISNLWFYYKVPILIGIVAVLLIVTTVINKVSEPKYDHSIAIISKYNYPNQENVERLTKIFEKKYGGTIEVKIYNVALGEIGEDENTISKLSLDLGNKISEFFFIEDIDTFKKTTADIEFSSVVLVSELDWLNNLGLNNFYYCIRK